MYALYYYVVINWTGIPFGIGVIFMRRLPIGFSIIAVCIGCFLILFAGGKKDGIEEWRPLNSEIQEAFGMEEAIKLKNVQDKNISDQDVNPPSTNKVETTNKDTSSEITSATEKASEEKPSLEAVSHEKNENVKEKEQEEILPNTDTSGKININTADLAALMDLPGIGEKKAQAIIDYRSKNGPFPSVSALMDVKGIGPKMLEKMKPYVAL